MNIDKETLKKLKEKAAPEYYRGGYYPFEIKYCPGYEGYIPKDLDHEVCKWCGEIKYYH
jgi:hypothetical protein